MKTNTWTVVLKVQSPTEFTGADVRQVLEMSLGDCNAEVVIVESEKGA